MSCVNCGGSVHGPSSFCPACGHPQQAAVAVLEPGPEPLSTKTTTASDRRPITGRLIAASALYFLLPFPLSVLLPGVPGAVVCAILEVAGLALAATTAARRGLAMALAVVAALAWIGLGDHGSRSVWLVVISVQFVVQFVAWLVATRRHLLPYVLIVAALVLAFPLGSVLVSGRFFEWWLGGSVVAGVLWAVLGLVAAWMPVPAGRLETAGGPVPGGGAPSAGSEISPLAVAAFVASFIVSLAGVVLGHMALGEIRRTGKRGHGLAVAALVIGYGAIALTLIAALAFLAGSGSGS